MPQTFPVELKALTSLRFVAALWVVLFHYRPYGGIETGQAAILDKGYLGVDFFFMLSGFILAHVYRNALNEHTYRHTDFLRRRIARIYPMHIVTFAFFAVLALIAPMAGLTLDSAGRYDFSKTAEQILMVHAWFGPGDQFNYPSWSISAEFFAYLLFPLVMVLARWPRLMFAAGLVATFGWYFAAVEIAGAPSTHLSGWPLMRIMPEFLLGAGMREFLSTRTIPFTNRAWSLPVAAAAVIALAAMNAPDWTLLIGMGLLVLTGAERSRAQINGVLERPGSLYLGEISYALYMVHVAVGMAVFEVANRALGEPTSLSPLFVGLIVLCTGLAVAVAAVCEKYLERPGRRWIMGLGRGRKSAPAVRPG